MGKWIDFQVKALKPKTKIYAIIAKQDGSEIGEIKWYAPWRQYAFFPYSNMVFEKTCLNDILQFLEMIKPIRKPKEGGA